MVQEPAFAEWLYEPLHQLVIRRADHCGLENRMTAKILYLWSNVL